MTPTPPKIFGQIYWPLIKKKKNKQKKKKHYLFFFTETEKKKKKSINIFHLLSTDTNKSEICTYSSSRMQSSW